MSSIVATLELSLYVVAVKVSQLDLEYGEIRHRIPVVQTPTSLYTSVSLEMTWSMGVPT